MISSPIPAAWWRNRAGSRLATLVLRESARAEGFADPLGQNLLGYLHSTVDAGLTSGTEHELMRWMKTKMANWRVVHAGERNPTKGV